MDNLRSQKVRGAQVILICEQGNAAMLADLQSRKEVVDYLWAGACSTLDTMLKHYPYLRERRFILEISSTARIYQASRGDKEVFHIQIPYEFLLKDSPQEMMSSIAHEIMHLDEGIHSVSKYLMAKYKAHKQLWQGYMRQFDYFMRIAHHRGPSVFSDMEKTGVTVLKNAFEDVLVERNLYEVLGKRMDGSYAKDIEALRVELRQLAKVTRGLLFCERFVFFTVIAYSPATALQLPSHLNNESKRCVELWRRCASSIREAIPPNHEPYETFFLEQSSALLHFDSEFRRIIEQGTTKRTHNRDGGPVGCWKFTPHGLKEVHAFITDWYVALRRWMQIDLAMYGKGIGLDKIFDGHKEL